MEAVPSRRPPERRAFAQFLWFWLPVLLYVTLILVLSSQPNLQPPFHFRNADKVAHIGEYFWLGILLARATRASMRLRFALAASLIALALGVLVGSFDEFYQSFIPGRDSSVYDLLADTIGVALAQLVYVTFAKD